MWRLAKNILPTRDNLSKKGILLENICPLCQSGVESTEHLFMQCQLARLTWFSSQLGHHIPQNLNLNDWLLHGLQCEEHLSVKIFCTTLWKFWKARNLCVFQNKPFNPIDIVHQAMDFVNELGTCSKKIIIPTHPNNIDSNIEPSVAENCMFVDAGCFAGGTTGWGLVCLDSSTAVRVSACLFDNIEVEPLVAEAMGVRWCLQFAIDHNMKRISLASDAAVVVNSLNIKCCIAALDSIILDCKMLVKQFEFVSVYYVRRSSNVIAHKLIGLSRSIGSKTWMGSLPRQLQAVLIPVFRVASTESQPL
jgi:hypothetical protein